MATIRFGEITKADIPDRNELQLGIYPTLDETCKKINNDTWTLIDDKCNSIKNTDSRWIIHYFVQLKQNDKNKVISIDLQFIYVDNFGNTFTEFSEPCNLLIPLSEATIKQIKAMKSNCGRFTFYDQYIWNGNTLYNFTTYFKTYINMNDQINTVHRIKTDYVIQQLFKRIEADRRSQLSALIPEVVEDPEHVEVSGEDKKRGKKITNKDDVTKKPVEEPAKKVVDKAPECSPKKVSKKPAEEVVEEPVKKIVKKNAEEELTKKPLKKPEVQKKTVEEEETVKKSSKKIDEVLEELPKTPSKKAIIENESAKKPSKKTVIEEETVNTANEVVDDDINLPIYERRKKIPKAIRTIVWNKYIGAGLTSARCICCRSELIGINNWHCGHVIAEAKGGDLNINNLRPICDPCNQSMGTKSMNEFTTEFFGWTI